VHFSNQNTPKRIAVIGAGIVGLATAYKLLQKHPEIKLMLIEKENDIAMHQTGHNSGVIHSGIYYQPGSLKAENCRKGYAELLRFCDENKVQYNICGKLIVATKNEEFSMLNDLYDKGLRNGLQGLKKLEAEEIEAYEPHVSGLKAIWVPETGIVDYYMVARSLLKKILSHDAEIFFKEKALDIKQTKQVEIITDKQIHQVDLVYNCAGLYSDKLAKKTQKIDYKIIPFRGEYYRLKKEKEYLVNNLIYPVPNPEFPFLGVHFTRMMKGGVEAGPNAVLAFGRESYRKMQFNFPELFEILTYPGFLKVAAKYWRDGAYEMYRSWSKKAFTKALQNLIPEIQENDLTPSGAGIRAQAISKSGNLVDDFLVLRDQNIIHVGNAPSPAATASLAIGDYLSGLIEIS